MAWFRFSALLLTGFLCCSFVAPAAPPDSARLEMLLSLQGALQQARDHLQRGHYLAAAQSLEAKIEILDAHPECLKALREAYTGLIREAIAAKKTDQAETYSRRLKALDPGALLELRTLAPAGKGGSTTAAVPPAPVPLTSPTGPTAPNPFTQSRPTSTGTTPAALASGGTAPGQVDTVRGVAQGDPFAEDNNTQLQEARSFLARAERDFADKNYTQALKYYDLTNTLAPKLLRDALDRWAYCKMHGVVAVLNQPGDKTPAEDLERTVRQAMSMAPEKLDRFGQELLRKIADRQGGRPPQAAVAGNGGGADPHFEVRHVGRQGNWNVAETTNFRVFHQLSEDTVERAARLAETTRLAMTRKWFNETPAPWPQKCDVYLHPTGRDYAHATQQSPSIPGHSTIRNEGERILSRQIDLHVDDPNALVGVLPHETTHVVLAGRFGPNPLPRWADEGLAVLSEPTDRIQRHLNTLPQHYQAGLLFKLSSLMSMDRYPEARSVPAFYAQGVSLCDYLVSKKNPQTFITFLREGMRTGWDGALQRHYGINNTAELEKQWLAAVLQNPVVRSESSRK